MQDQDEFVAAVPAQEGGRAVAVDDLFQRVGDDDQRLIVAARRLRENESPDNLILKNGGNLS